MYVLNTPEYVLFYSVSDDVALSVIYTAYVNGLNVPEDISVIGYDNSGISYMSVPPLTTVSQLFYEMGRDGCLSVISAIKTKEN